eukprot:6600814-Pyramimonas_sp.AAC.1
MLRLVSGCCGSSQGQWRSQWDGTLGTVSQPVADSKSFGCGRNYLVAEQTRSGYNNGRLIGLEGLLRIGHVPRGGEK